MDIYLPADFYALRDDMNEWRTLGTSTDSAKSADRTVHAPDQGDADPSWRVI